MRTKTVIGFTLILTLSLLIIGPTFSASIFSVVGTVRNADGTLAASGLTVVVENKARDLTSEDTLGKQEPGKYGVVFVDTGNKIVAAKGDTLNITVKNVEETVAGVTYQLTADDIAKGRAIVDINLVSPTPVNQTNIFTVVGTIRNTDDTLAVAGLEVSVTNETKGLTATASSGEQEPGKYGVVFLNTENEPVAAQGDLIKVTIEDTSLTYQLTADDIAKGRAIVDLRLGTVLPGNQSPIASLSFAPEDVYVNVEITFDASASSDPDGRIVTYEWDFGDGSIESGQIAKHTYASEGQYDAALKVTDDDGKTAVVNAKVAVSQAPMPKVHLSDPDHDFGSIPVGSFADYSLTIANFGDALLTINSVVPDASAFAIVLPPFPQYISPMVGVEVTGPMLNRSFSLWISFRS